MSDKREYEGDQAMKNVKVGSWSDEDLEHMMMCTSQYDSTCRKLAAELLIARRQLRMNDLGITEQDIAETMPPRPEEAR